MGRPGPTMQRQLATTQAAARSIDLPSCMEGVVLAGSWDATEGVCQVMIGSTVGYESSFFSENGLNQPLYLVCRLETTQIGDQYGPVGGERAVVYEGEGGFVCKLVHGPDDSSQVPSGERWILHRSAAASNPTPDGGMDSGDGGYDSGRGGYDLLESPLDAPIPVAWDTSLKLTNDGPTTGDGLGGARLGNGGALTESSTASGARSTIDDTAQKIEAVTAAGLTTGSYDQIKQIVASIVAGELETIIDGIAQKITHQVNPEVQVVIDALAQGGIGAISHVVPSGGMVALGALSSALSNANLAAMRNTDISTFENALHTQRLLDLENLATAVATALASASPPVTLTPAAIIALIASLVHISVPSGSSVVRIAP